MSAPRVRLLWKMDEEFELAKIKVIKGVKASNYVCGLYDNGVEVRYGDYVVSGINTEGVQVIGYVVQIRKNWGAFGSDMFFIRERTGQLYTHENQSFWILTREQVALIDKFFGGYTPEKEIEFNPNILYTILGKHEERGFIISKDDAPDRTDSCHIAVKVSND